MGATLPSSLPISQWLHPSGLSAAIRLCPQLPFPVHLRPPWEPPQYFWACHLEALSLNFSQSDPGPLNPPLALHHIQGGVHPCKLYVATKLSVLIPCHSPSAQGAPISHLSWVTRPCVFHILKLVPDSRVFSLAIPSPVTTGLAFPYLPGLRDFPSWEITFLTTSSKGAPWSLTSPCFLHVLYHDL